MENYNQMVWVPSRTCNGVYLAELEVPYGGPHHPSVLSRPSLLPYCPSHPIAPDVLRFLEQLKLVPISGPSNESPPLLQGIYMYF